MWFGDEAIWWAVESALSGAAAGSAIDIIRLVPGSEPEVAATFPIGSDDLSVVIDEHRGHAMVGFVRSAPPRGLAITRIYLIDLVTGQTEELEVTAHISSARANAGGGLQMLVLP